MRPVRLSLEGFTSLKEETVLDFSDLDLFVIYGATGAGKSSLLDAMTYALYGEVPRAARRSGIADFISLGRSKLSVTFEFTLQGENYRVTRSATRRKNGVESKAMLDVRRGNQFEFVQDGVGKVDEILCQKLRLGSEAFTQAVVLPQGQFAAFLQSEPRKRRQMLNELLQLQVLERMQKTASARRQELDTQVENLSRRLTEDFVNVSRDELERTRREIVTLDKDSAKATDALAAGEQELAELVRQHRLHQDRGAARQSLAELERREPEIVRHEERLRRSQAAAAIVPRLDEADRDRAAVVTLEQMAQQLQTRFDTAAREHAAGQAVREKAEQAAAEIPALERRRLELAEAAGKAEFRGRLQTQLASLVETLEKKRQKHIELTTGLDDLAKEEAGASRRLTEIDRQIRDDPLPLDLDVRLERGRTLVDQHVTKRHELVRLNDEADALDRQVVAADAACKEARRRQQRADRNVRQRESALAAAVADRDRQRHARLVDELRRELSAGESCPVCGSAVACPPPPSHPHANGLDPVPALEQTLQTARTEATLALAEATTIETTRERLGAQVADLRERAARQENEIAALESELRKTIVDSSEAGVGVEEAYASWTTQMTRRREQHARWIQEFAILHEKRCNIDRSRSAFRITLKDLDEETSAAQMQRSQIEQSLREIEAHLPSGMDPQRELEEIGAAIAARTDALTAARREESLRSQALEGARIRWNQHQAETTKATERAAQSAARAEQGLREAGVATVAEARAAYLEPAEANRIATEVAAFRQSSGAVRRRLTELDAAITSEPVDPARIAELEQEVQALEREAKDMFAETVRRQEDLRRLEHDVVRFEELEAERRVADEQLAVFRQLAEDLKSDRFQAYMLEETLSELMQGASRQLARLTGDRFGLDFADDQIRVVDHDNAGEFRSTDTLSGGETFLASLALALELSAQVQRSVGAVSLDCLFIDEGFGNLDPDSLRTVADSIRSLQVGGRMVGIITHLPEFIEQFDQRVFVEKKGGVSSLRVEGVA
jgi:exonuclease SbcC